MGVKNITNEYSISLKSNHKKRKKGFLFELNQNKIAYLMSLPGVLVILAFSIVPLIFIGIAFEDYNYVDGFFRSPFVGLKNFQFFFSSGDKAWLTVYNTVVLNILFIAADLILQIGFAVMLNEIKSKLFKKVSQTLFFFPYFLSWVVIGTIVYGLFSSEYGAINNILGFLGMGTVQWYNHPEYWKGILVLTHIWKWTGYGSIIYLATISGFDTSCYESAHVDGVTKLQEIVYITLPLLKPTAVVLVLFSVGRIFFGDFGMVYAIVRDVGPLLETTEVIDTYVFRAMRQTGDFSMTTAIGLFQSIMGLVTIVLCNKLAKKINDGSGLF